MPLWLGHRTHLIRTLHRPAENRNHVTLKICIPLLTYFWDRISERGTTLGCGFPGTVVLASTDVLTVAESTGHVSALRFSLTASPHLIR